MKGAELKIEEIVPFSNEDVDGEELERSSARKVKRGRKVMPKSSRKREASKPLYLSRYE
jgi:hypothetical protein